VLNPLNPPSQGDFESILMREQDFLQKLKSVPFSFHPVLIGIGDDAAVIGDDVVVTTDTLVDGVHFSRSYFSPEQIGKKAVEVNVSDVLAMGGIPTYLVLSVSVPTTVNEHYLLRFYEGVKEACSKYGIALVGGDTSKAPHDFSITITLLGTVIKEELLLCSGAQVGDVIAVSGELGASAVGLELLQGTLRLPFPESDIQWLKNMHLEPIAQFETGRFLAQSGMVHALTDVSDGIASDMRKITTNSRVSAVLDFTKIPVFSTVQKAMSIMKKPLWQSGVFGGEEYEFLFTVGKEQFSPLEQAAKMKGILLTEIGFVDAGEDGRVYVEENSGEKKEFTAMGFDHFAKN